MWWRRSTERVRTVSLFKFHLGAGDGLCVVGVGFVLPRHFMALVLTTLRRTMLLKNQRHYMHVDGRQKMVFTVLRGRLCLMYVTHLSTMTMLPPLAAMPNRDGGTGMQTMLWDINVIPN